MLATRPERPSGDRGPGRGAELAAAIATALDVETAEVRAILDANRPARPDRGERGEDGPGRPDRSALVTALAEGLDRTEAQVTAALDAAEELGLSAAAVRAALEATRPARPPHGPRDE